MLSLFPVIVLNNIGWNGLTSIPHSEAPLCFVVKPRLSRLKECTVPNWKCKRKFRQNGMLHKQYLGQDSWDYPNVCKKLWCFFHAWSTNMLKTGGMSAAHCGSFYDITIKQILMPHMRSHVGFRHSQDMGPAPRKSLWEQMCVQQYKVT